MYISIYMWVWTWVCARVCVCVFLLVCMCVCVNIHAHIYIQTYIHQHTHIHTYTWDEATDLTQGNSLKGDASSRIHVDEFIERNKPFSLKGATHQAWGGAWGSSKSRAISFLFAMGILNPLGSWHSADTEEMYHTWCISKCITSYTSHLIHLIVSHLIHHIKYITSYTSHLMYHILYISTLHHSPCT